MMHVYRNCSLASVGLLRDADGRDVIVDVSEGGVYTVSVVPLGPTLFSTAVLEIKKAGHLLGPRKSLASAVTVTSTASTHLTAALSPEAPYIALEVTTAEAGRFADVHVWHLPATPAVVGP